MADMTQEDFNTARDKIAEALNVIANSLIDEAQCEVNVEMLMLAHDDLNSVIRAVYVLERNDPVSAQGILGFLDEPDVDDEVCTCGACTEGRWGTVKA
jgi:hypothetical protein